MKNFEKAFFRPALLPVALLLLALASGCSAAKPGALTQFSTIDAILAGAYDGFEPVKDLDRHGNFGIGTFDRLNGEMVLLNGTVFQVLADGSVRKAPPEAPTPFAAVANFRTDRTLPVPGGTNLAAFEELADLSLENPNLFYGVKLHGVFSHVRTRSVPAQKKPYPPLTEVTAHQPEFERNDVSGTLLGFRCPAFVKGIGVPGFHLHFLSDDRKFGGHVLAFTLQEGVLELDRLNRFVLVLPEGEEEFRQADLSRDRSRELRQAETR